MRTHKLLDQKWGERKSFYASVGSIDKSGIEVFPNPNKNEPIFLSPHEDIEELRVYIYNSYTFAPGLSI